MLDFIEKPVTWFTVQIKWLVSIWNATLDWNGLRFFLVCNNEGTFPKIRLKFVRINSLLFPLKITEYLSFMTSSREWEIQVY